MKSWQSELEALPPLCFSLTFKSADERNWFCDDDQRLVSHSFLYITVSQTMVNISIIGRICYNTIPWPYSQRVRFTKSEVGLKILHFYQVCKRRWWRRSKDHSFKSIALHQWFSNFSMRTVLRAVKGELDPEGCRAWDKRTY